MNYFHHQFQHQQVQPIHQTGFNNNHYYQDHDPRFQQSQNMGQFPLHGRGGWVDPFAGRTLLQSHRTETKPRLSKGEVARLESVFQENNKPSSSVKKDLANQMRVDVARINNWFQNRRAKKKQELKAKELETIAEAERETDGRGATEGSETNDDVSSDQDRPAIKTEPRSPAVCDDALSTVEDAKPQGGSIPSESCPHDDRTNHTSPEDATADYERGQFEYMPAGDAAYLAPHSGDGHPGMMATSNADFDSGMGVSAPMGYSMQGSADSLEAFSYEALMFPGLPEEMGPFETRVDGFADGHFTGYQTEGVQPSIESNYKSSPEAMGRPSPLITQSFRLRSPPAIDLAGRRKQPGLALAGIRSTSNGPATGFDFGRRDAPKSPMRRVTSATGFGPHGIRRFPSQQRGGMFDRRQESLLHAVRSPPTNPCASMAPPTPDTPVVATHQSVREATVSSSSSEEGSVFSNQAKILPSHASILDRSVRTPPATPIDVFARSMGASLGYPTTEEAFLASGMDAYSMRSNEYIPSYVADGYISQPATPQPPMSTGYYSTNHTEYSWADTAMVSTKSSPIPSQMRQIQFSNVTPQDFSGGK